MFVYNAIPKFLQFLDPGNQLLARDWVAIFTFLFAVFSFFVTQSLTARSQRITRQIAVRPYFSIIEMTRNIKLSTELSGVEKGYLITNNEYDELLEKSQSDLKVNDSVVKDVRFIQVKNLGPSYALDVTFEFKCFGNDKTNEWTIKGHKRVVDKDEYVYIPINNVNDYPKVKISETKITFKTQASETIVILQKPDFEKDMSSQKIYKKIMWGCLNKKIVKLSNVTGRGTMIK